jgi:hypothetical protein
MRRKIHPVVDHLYVRAALAAALILLLGNCSSSSMPTDPPLPSRSTSTSGLPSGRAAAVEHATGDQLFNTQKHDDSPAPPHEVWRGVLIKAPAIVRLDPRRPVVIVRGVYVLSGLQVPPKATLKLIAIDVQSRKRYEALMGQQDPSPDEPAPDPPPLDPGLRERLTFNGHFNAELMATLNLPLVPASYVVSAHVGTALSNEISVKLQLQ